MPGENKNGNRREITVGLPDPTDLLTVASSAVNVVVGSAAQTPISPVPRPAPLGPVVRAAGSPLLARLLKMAQAYRRDGAIRQAVDLYLDVAEKDPTSAEAQSARTAVLEIADEYERTGNPRQARHLLERLL